METRAQLLYYVAWPGTRKGRNVTHVLLAAAAQEPDPAGASAAPAADGTSPLLVAAVAQEPEPAGASATLIAEGPGPPRNSQAPAAPAVALPAAGGGFAAFVVSTGVVPLMRRVLEIVEAETGLHSYHLRVVPWIGGIDGHVGGKDSQRAELEALLAPPEAALVRRTAARSGFLLYCAGDNERERDVPAVDGLDALDAPIRYADANGRYIEVPDLWQRDVQLWPTEPEGLVRCSLDWQGRPCIIVSLSPVGPAAARARAQGLPVRRMSELGDEELAELWRSVGKAVQLHGEFEDLRLNAGTYQNLAHLHIKVFFEMTTYLAVWGQQPVFKALRQWRATRAWSKGA